MSSIILHTHLVNCTEVQVYYCYTILFRRVA
jgi:hypothetical protein